MWLGRLDKSLNIFFEGDIEWILYSSCLPGSAVGIEDTFEMCGSSHQVVEKINTHLVTEIILFSLEGLALTDSLGESGNLSLIRAVMI